MSSICIRARIGLGRLNGRGAGFGTRRLVGMGIVGMGGALFALLSSPSEAQIVRRFAGGGVQVNAPFVRVNVGPGGTSVRAPFTAVDTPGRVFVGRRRRFMAQPQYAVPPQPQYAAPPRYVAPRSHGSTPQPTPVDVDALPSPTYSQLAAMDDATLVETLREMMGRFNYRLSRLKTGAGWQDYLILSREVLGSPGAPPEAAEYHAIREVLPRYASVQGDPQFEKISALPSFAAAYAALQEAERRLANIQPVGPGIANPSDRDTTPIEKPAEEVLEILPTPQPAELPNATRGERSILKR